MSLQYSYIIAQGVEVERENGRAIAVTSPFGRIDLTGLGGAWQMVVEQIPEQGIAVDDLSRQMIASGYNEGLANLFFAVDRMLAAGLLRIKVGDIKHPDALLIPGSVLFSFPSTKCQQGKQYRLSRFAYQRAEDGQIILESPRSLAALVLSSAKARSWVNSWSKPQVFGRRRVQPDSEAAAFAHLLLGLEFLVLVDADGKTEEESEKRYRYWEFHDLLFHGRSRIGRHSHPVGATFPFKGIHEPEPALPALDYKSPPIPLFKPDMDRLLKEDFPFTSVLEYRRSIRSYGESPVSLEQLGEFLYRTSRVRAVFPIDPARESHYETSSRPYPSGGGSYEFELYLTVRQCGDLAQGIYHYDAQEHVLRLVQDDPRYVQALLHDAWISAAQSVHPQVLITYAPRFARLAWKYRGMGYSASLKNAGALYQTMYLVATAMKLAPCALGNGNAFLFSKAIGSDYFLSSSTAEFMLGSMPKP